MSVESESSTESFEYVEGDVKVNEGTSKETSEENTQQNDSEEKETIPEEFSKVINDLCSDIKTTFPETEALINSYYQGDEIQTSMLFGYVKQVYPERFFDILYQNNEIFDVKSEVNTEFLPGLDFKSLWNMEDVSDQIRETLWKYLQLLLFTSVGNLTDSNSFGDTAKLFEAINEDEFKSKLGDVMENIQNIFENKGEGFTSMNHENEENEENCEKESSTPNPNDFRNVFENMPNPETIHSHISSMLDGKLGKLATEIAEETAGELDIDFSDATQPEDVMKKLFKNPGKLMGLVKKVGSKLDTKLKSGQIDEKELMSEASELMRKMKDMPGMGNMEEMLKKMNIPGLGGKNARFNQGAFNNAMKRQDAREKMRERAIKAKQDKEMQKQKEEEERKLREQNYKPLTDEELILEFETLKVGNEKGEKSARPNNNGNKKKKKKNKK